MTAINLKVYLKTHCLITISKHVSSLQVECHEALLEECRRLAMERNGTLSSVMNLSAIKMMSELLPKSQQEFLKIQHVTAANYKKFGEFFLKITQDYRAKVEALEIKMRSINLAHKRPPPSYEQDEWVVPDSSQRQGVKRKSPNRNKKTEAKRFKSTYKKRKRKSPGKKKSPKKKLPAKKTYSPRKFGAAKKGEGSSSKGGGLGLMPVLHIK